MTDLGGWTEDRIALAAKLWADGKSASQVASAVSALGWGVSRSAVLGKLYRLGLLGTQTAALKAGAPPMSIRARSPRMPQEALRRADLPPPLPPRPFKRRAFLVHSPTPLAFADMPTTGHCRWPLETDEFAFCGNRSGLKAYCEGHHAVAYDAKRTAQANAWAEKSNKWVAVPRPSNPDLDWVA